MAIHTMVMTGTTLLFGGTRHNADHVYAYLCHDMNCDSGEFVASSGNNHGLPTYVDYSLYPWSNVENETYGPAVAWEDTSAGFNCYDGICSDGQFKMQFTYDSVYDGMPVLLLEWSGNHGFLPQSGQTDAINNPFGNDLPPMGYYSDGNDQNACNNIIQCTDQAPMVGTYLPSINFNLYVSNPTVTTNDDSPINLQFPITSLNDGYGNNYLSVNEDVDSAIGQYIEGQLWEVKKNNVSQNVSDYLSYDGSPLTDENHKIYNNGVGGASVVFTPDEIVSNIALEMYTLKLTQTHKSLNDYHEGTIDAYSRKQRNKTITITVINSDYITPLDNVCCDPTATDYVCLNSMYGNDSNYCNSGCDFGGCSDNMYVDDPLIISCGTPNVNYCNYVPGLPDLNVTYTPGNINVIVNAQGSTDPNGLGASDLRYFYYNMGDGTQYTKTNDGNFSHSYALAGEYTITLQTEDYAGAQSEVVSETVNITVCGCTDPNASNYNPVANLEAGTCQYDGCVYPDADNWICDDENFNNIFPCILNPPPVDGACSSLNGEEYHLPDHVDYWQSFTYHVHDNDTCVFPPDYVNPNYTTVISDYIVAGNQGYTDNFQVTLGPETYELSAPDLDTELKNRIDTSYSINFKPYFPEIIPDIKTQECPSYCWDGSNATSYCTNASCLGWHLNLMEEEDCNGLCVYDSAGDGTVTCTPLDCQTDCSSTYCDIGNTQACCPSVGTDGDNSCISEDNCLAQYPQEWCDSDTSYCCSNCTETDGSCCSDYYDHNLETDGDLADKCLDMGNGYCDTCCEEDDCSEYYEDISTQFADVTLPILPLGNPSFPSPSYIGYVADDTNWIDDALSFDGVWQPGDIIVGSNYDETTGEILPSLPAVFNQCPWGASLGPNCDNEFCPPNPPGPPPFQWKNPVNCNSPLRLKKLVPGRGYIVFAANGGNISFNDVD